MSEIEEFINECTKIEDNIGIYAVGCKVAKIAYIGQSTNIRNRLSQHKSSLKSGKHSNYGFQGAMKELGINNAIYKTLQICPKHELRDLEGYYIRLFKQNGYKVFGDGDTSEKFNFLESEIGMNKNEEKYLAYLDKKYFIMLKEFKKKFYDPMSIEGNVVYDDYTNFLMKEMLNGIELYNESDEYINIMIMDFIKSDVTFIGSSFNYIAYPFFYNIFNNHSLYKREMEKDIERKTLFPYDYSKECFISRIIDEFKSDKEINNEIIKVSTFYSVNYEKLKDKNILDVVRYFTKRGKRGGAHFFDFLFYYIVIIYCECLISVYT